MKESICVKVLKAFPNPLTNRKAKVGQYLNVPENIFWLRRILSGDCEKSKPQKQKPIEIKKDKSSKQGSK